MVIYQQLLLSHFAHNKQKPSAKGQSFLRLLYHIPLATLCLKWLKGRFISFLKTFCVTDLRLRLVRLSQQGTEAESKSVDTLAECSSTHGTRISIGSDIATYDFKLSETNLIITVASHRVLLFYVEQILRFGLPIFLHFAMQ